MINYSNKLESFDRSILLRRWSGICYLFFHFERDVRWGELESIPDFYVILAALDFSCQSKDLVLEGRIHRV